jgi:hypothetical protein
MSRSTRDELEFFLFLCQLQKEISREFPSSESRFVKRPLKEFINLLPSLFQKYRWMFAQDADQTWKSSGVERSISANDSRMVSVIERATYDRAAGRGLHDYIRGQINSGEPLPQAAKSYLNDLLAGEITPPKGPAGRPKSTEYRDHLVLEVLKALVDKHGLRPTRARKRTATATACSIVTEALALASIHVSEDTIEQIWKHHRRASGAAEQVARQRNS